MGTRRGCNWINILRLRFVSISMYLKLHGYSKPVLVQGGSTSAQALPAFLASCHHPLRPQPEGQRSTLEQGRWKSSRKGLKHTLPLIFHSCVFFSSLINLHIHEFTLNSSPGRRKSGISLHEERASLCPGAHMMAGSQCNPPGCHLCRDRALPACGALASPATFSLI